MLHTANSALVQGAVFGGLEGDRFDDPRALGWPHEKNLNVDNPISQIVVRHGWVVNAINVTYNLVSGSTATINHGAQYGGNVTRISISSDEVITSVVGKAGPHNFYKKGLLNQITFVIANTKTSQVRVVGPLGNSDQADQGSYFQASGVIALAGVQTDGAGTGAGISGLSFFSSKAWA